jgi:hypothetical protein
LLHLKDAISTEAVNRLEIIMPDIFSIILFPNAHNLLVVFLYISAIIPNLCSKNLNSIDTRT